MPAVASTWLIAQQCDNGGFRISLTDTGTSCTANTQADLDATSFALMALAASEDDSDATVDAFEDGLNYVLDQQAADGSFGTGNGNSTGLAASVVRGVGDAPDANKAAAFIVSNSATHERRRRRRDRAEQGGRRRREGKRSRPRRPARRSNAPRLRR